MNVRPINSQGDVFEKASRVLETLEIDLALNFEQAVTARLRRLTDREVNTLYLMTHTAGHMGDHVHIWMKVLMPIIEKEHDLRRDIEVLSYIGPVIAPELYRKGGGHYVPF